MKKILSLVLAVVMLCFTAFTMISCSDGLSTDPLAESYNEFYKENEAPKEGGNGTLTVAMSPDFAPMEFVDLSLTGSKQYVGFDVLLANYIAKELDMSLVIKPMSFDACMSTLQAGQVDLAISGFSWTAKRAENFLISDYYIAGDNETEQILITKDGNTFDWVNATDLTDKKIGAQGGSLQQLLVEEQLVTKGAEIVLMENINDLVTLLKNDQIDALAVAAGNADAIIASNEDVKTTGFFFEIEEKYKNNVILVNKNDQELLDDVNEALAKAMAADVYDAWYAACETYAGIESKDESGYDDDGNKNEVTE